ncbi:HAD domain-containing protein [Pseudomonas aeruginosa]
MILFLDIDGVLHPDPPQPDQRLRSLPRLVEILRDHPQVEVVISSLWREHLSLDQLRDLFPADLRARIIDVTPIAERIDGWLPARREVEILEWLAASGRADEYWLALDDQAWQFTQHRDRLIACTFYDGVTDVIEAQLRQRLADGD